jgi:hypothetical protein
MVLLEAALDFHVRSLREELARAIITDANAVRSAGQEHLNSLHSLAGSRDDVSRLIDVARFECNAYLKALCFPSNEFADPFAALNSIGDLEVALA